MQNRAPFAFLCVLGSAHAASGHDSMWSAEWWLVYLTSALAVVTGLLFYSTFRLAKDARDTSKRQAEEVKESFAIARAAAAASQRSAEIAEQALFISQRAYIGIETVWLNGVDSPQFGFRNDVRTLTAQVAYKN